ncbi:MAG: hypothetical protein Ct9H300mP12_10310 [Acidimicrobiales bacterium]|nr:MAG: hypothetical protein Ct9H300mP12_10310 [Acidimicrobiales bacterium]
MGMAAGKTVLDVAQGFLNRFSNWLSCRWAASTGTIHSSTEPYTAVWRISAHVGRGAPGLAAIEASNCSL